MLIKLLDNVTANTNGAAFHCSGSDYTLIVFSTDFGSGTVQLQISPDSGTTWVALMEDGLPTAYTSNVTKLIQKVSTNFLIRAVLTGATSPSALSVYIAD